MKKFGMLVGINSFINAIWLFLKIDFSILFFQFTRFKNLLGTLDTKAKLIFFYAFNVFLVGVWNDISVQIFKQYDIGRIYVLNLPLAIDFVEYFGALIISYIVLIFSVEFIFYRLNDSEIDEIEIIKSVIGATSCFLSVLLFSRCFWVVYEYISLKTEYRPTELLFLGMVLKYIFWLVCIYLSSYSLPKIKRVLIVSCTIVLMSAVLLLEFLCNSFVKNPYIDVINATARMERDAEIRYLKDYQGSQLVAKGYSLSDLNSLSEELKDVDELCFRDRYRYKLIFILTTLLKEDISDIEIEKALRAVMKNNYEYAYKWLVDNKDRFYMEEYKYISTDEVELARVEFTRLVNFKEKYEKEILFDVHYDTSLEEDENGNVEYIVNELDKDKTLYFINKFIRFLP